MARYDSLRKLKRNIQLLRYAQRHPDLSGAEIGKEFGLSRGRVSQILHPPSKPRKKKEAKGGN